MSEVELTTQGRLLKVRVVQNYTPLKNSAPYKRGTISEFSRRSRKRMLDMVATIDMPPIVHFVTLTIADDNVPQNSEVLQSWLGALWERMRRAFPDSSAIWRIEPKKRRTGKWQGRSVPHVHILAFNVPEEALPDQENKHYSGWFHDAWEAITGHHAYYPDDGWHDLRTEHKRIIGDRALMYYTAKYAAKTGEENPLVGVPYSHAGRHWGVFNRKNLPLFPEIRITKNIPRKAFFDMRRSVMRKTGMNYSRRRSTGWTLYTDNAAKWADYLYSLILCNEHDKLWHA